MVLCENYLICFFMSFNEDLIDDGKIIGKEKVSNNQELEPWG